MKKIKEIYITLAEFVQSINKSTLAIIMGVLFALAFYNFAIWMKKNKGDNTSFKSIATFFMFLVILGVIALIISCLNY